MPKGVHETTPSIYEEQTFVDEVRQAVHVKIGERSAGPTDEEIDAMTPEEVRRLCESWSVSVGSDYC